MSPNNIGREFWQRLQKHYQIAKSVHVPFPRIALVLRVRMPGGQFRVG